MKVKLFSETRQNKSSIVCGQWSKSKKLLFFLANLELKPLKQTRSLFLFAFALFLRIIFPSIFQIGQNCFRFKLKFQQAWNWSVGDDKLKLRSLSFCCLQNCQRVVWQQAKKRFARGWIFLKWMTSDLLIKFCDMTSYSTHQASKTTTHQPRYIFLF